MITPQNRIIIVDDEQEELNTLTSEFLDIGLGCRPFLYEEGKYDLGFTDVRLAFFDINITHKSVVEKGELSNEDFYKANNNVYNDLVNAINSFINIENGPFALIFWTNNAPLIEGFKLYIDERRIELAKPFFISCIDKMEIKNRTLPEKLNEILENDKIKFYIEIEENARIAGSNTIDKLHNIIPKDTKWSDNSEYFNNIDKVLSKIAVSVLGFESAKSKPLKGVYEGLSQLVLKEFLSLESQIDSTKLMAELINAKEQSEIQFPNDEIPNKLNAIFHLEETTDFDYSTRGGVFKLNLNRLTPKEFNPVYHLSLDQYFKNIETFNQSIFFRFNNEITDKIESVIKEKIEFVAIEISASCDYSQNKKRNNKFILGLLTPNIESYLDSSSISKSILYKDLPAFHYKNEKHSLFLNLNYVFSDSEITFLGEPLFILKKELIDLIGNRYANHVSRIGITSF
jgi:hypothetical protein